LQFANCEFNISNMKKNNGMRPQDVVILLKIAAKGDKDWLMKDISAELFISASEVSEALNRNVYAGLIAADKRRIMKMSFLDFLRYGLKYVFPQRLGSMTRGIPTAHAASPLNSIIQSDKAYVLPHPKGETNGLAIEPLIASLPEACLQDAVFYELIALTDALRIGNVREQQLAYEVLKNRL
jgi:hypothetical protein